jgi:hypothetical protein
VTPANQTARPGVRRCAWSSTSSRPNRLVYCCAHSQLSSKRRRPSRWPCTLPGRPTPRLRSRSCWPRPVGLGPQSRCAAPAPWPEPAELTHQPSEGLIIGATGGSARPGWASNAAATDPRVCPELPEDNPPDHGWSCLGEGGRECVGFAGHRRGRRRDQGQRLIAVVAGNGAFPATSPLGRRRGRRVAGGVPGAARGGAAVGGRGRARCGTARHRHRGRMAGAAAARGHGGRARPRQGCRRLGPFTPRTLQALVDGHRAATGSRRRGRHASTTGAA